MNIALRVDASLLIGSGHVMRCLTLAQALEKRGATCFFICKAHAGNLVTLIEAARFKVVLLPITTNYEQEKSNSQYASWLGGSQDDDAAQTLVHLLANQIDWLVVDHYALDQQWELAVARQCQKIMVIDDLANRKHACTSLVDQSLGRKAQDYALLLPRECKLFLGPQFAMLRSEFKQLRQKSLARRKHPQLRRVMINMGGVDADNVTSRILTALLSLPLIKVLKIDVIMGKTAPWIEEVQRIATHWPGAIEVSVNVTDMALRLSKADLAIGAAGTSTWERACLGVPTILIVLADNQKNIAQKMSAESATIATLDHADIATQLPLAMTRATDTHSLSIVSKRTAQFTDGTGVDQIAAGFW